MSFTLRVLGSFGLQDASGNACRLPAKKGQALLTWLALHPGEAQSRNRLASLLWADSTDNAARHSLRQNLASLRRVVGAPVLQAARETVALRTDGLTVDALEFERLADEQSLRSLERACALYRGDLLQGFRPRAAPFEEWLAAERSRLHERALDAMDGLLARYLAGGDGDLAMPLANRLLALDPVRESAHRALMELHARRGHHTEALRQYRKCIEALERHLGIDPAPATLELREKIAARRGRKPTAAAHELRVAGPGRPLAERGAHDAMQAEVHHAVALNVGLVTGRGADTLPAEREHALLSRFNAAVDAALARFGGCVVQRSHTSIGAVFGLPRAQTNDAERVLHCARAIHDAVDDEKRGGAAPRVRTAIAVGRVVASRLEGAAGFTVTGALVDDCAALLARAQPGDLLIDRTTRDELPARYATRRIGGRPPGWQVVSAAAELKPSTAFVGRVTERNAFAAALETCTSTRRGRVWLLRGEAGIGKTRLLDEWLGLARRSGYACLLTRALDYGAAIGHDTIAVLVRQLTSLSLDARRPERDQALRRLLASDALPQGDQLYLYDLLELPMPELLAARYRGMEHAVRQQGRRRTIARLLEARSAESPVLLAAEDMHWADAATLRTIAQLTQALEPLPVTTVLTLRRGDEPDDVQWRSALAAIDAKIVDVTPLQPSELRTLAAQLPGADAIDTVETLIERSGGNPLFFEQLLAAAGEGMARVPESVQSIASARLDRLERRDRIALQAASALGERFTLPVLRHLVGDGDYEPVALIAEGLVAADARELRFGHVLIRDGTYATLLDSQRRALHQRAAGWYALRDTSLHAEQLERAGDPAAGDAYRRAAEEQAAGFHYHRALRLIERARALARNDETAADLDAERGRLLQAVGDIEPSIEAFEAALEHAGSPAARCRALLGIAGGLRIVGRTEPALDLLTHAQALAATLGDHETLARIYHLRGNLLFLHRDPEAVRRAHEQALACARRAAVPELEALAVGGLGDAAFMAARQRTAYGHYDSCVTLCQRHDLQHLLAAGLAMRCHAGYSLLQVEQAMDDALAADEAARSVANARDQWCAQMGLGVVRLHLGDLEQARESFETAISLARKIGAPHCEANAAGHVGFVIISSGDRAAAEAVIDEALALCRRTDSVAFTGPWLLGALAWAAADERRRGAALAEGEAVLAAGAPVSNAIAFYYFAIEACVEQGDWRNAKRYAQSLERVTANEPLPLSDAIITRARLLVRYLRGERSSALAAAARQHLHDIRATGYGLPDPQIENIAAQARAPQAG